MFASSGCNSPDAGSASGLNAASAIASGVNIVTTEPATSSQCPNGGTVVITFTDLNGTGILQSGDPILSSTPICNGQNGESVVFTSLPATVQECPDGGSVLVMASDTEGTGVYSPLDEHQQSTVVCNGAPGTSAPQSPFTILQAIMPCGSESSPYKEVLLCMADGSILADLSANLQGDETRLAFLPAGNYEDTDASGCNFNISNDGHGGLEVTWGGGSNAYATWGAGSTDCVNTANAPAPTPSPSPSPSPTPTPSPSPSKPCSQPSPSPSPSSSPSPVASAAPSPSPSPSQTGCTGPFCGGGVGV